VVDEGDFEPRSVGSYVLRVYKGSSSFPTDHLVAGLIRRRNGTLEALRFADVDGDQEPEIVVVIRSVGSGGYVSADAFRYRLRSLQLIASVSDLEPERIP
jgi:Periplasmic lysozyme inhibitor of I-type lysozyme